jgi:hypothetical protein
MGYRSDVTMIMYPRADHRDKFALLKLYVAENLPDEFEAHESDSGFRYLYCYIDGVKWYDDYDEVSAYTKAFNEWNEMFADPDDSRAKEGLRAEPIFQYEFMRVGEEYEDVQYERSYGSDHALNLSREVYVDL